MALSMTLGTLLAVAFCGCGPVMYTSQIRAAARAVEQARVAQAPERAPYEYYLAEDHLEKAREEAAEASYQDAIRFAKTAEQFGVKAQDLARTRAREAGR